MYVKGVGMTKFGIEARTSYDMAQEAILDALDNADMSGKDIDMVVGGYGHGGFLAILLVWSNKHLKVLREVIQQIYPFTIDLIFIYLFFS